MFFFLKKSWQVFFNRVYFVSIGKYWTTKNFLKVVFYLCFWIVLLKLILCYIYSSFFIDSYGQFSNVNILEVMSESLAFWSYGGNLWEFAAEHYAVSSSVINQNSYFYNFSDMKYICDVNRYIHYTWNNFGERYSSLSFNDFITNFIIYQFFLLIGVIEISLTSLLVLIIFLFIFMHLYFSLNNVFKDYVRDISIPLQFFYFFTSLFILINIFVIIKDIYLFSEANGTKNLTDTITLSSIAWSEYNEIFCDCIALDYNLDSESMINRTCVLYAQDQLNGFPGLFFSFIALQEYTLKSIFVFSILYIILYLSVNFAFSKNQNQFFLNIKYMLISIVSVYIFITSFMWLVLILEYSFIYEYIIELSETVKINLFSGGAFYMDTYKLAYDIGYSILNNFYLLWYELFDMFLDFIETIL